MDDLVKERREIDRICGEEEVRKLVTSLKGRGDKAKISVLDAAYWMKGCSSLGRLRYAVLVGVRYARGRKGEYKEKPSLSV